MKLLAPALICLATLLAGCGDNTPPGPPPPAPDSASASESAPFDEAAFFDAFRPLTLAPVSTFEESCANCHGPQGSFYGEAFAQLAEPELREFVHDMMVGPAFLSPTEVEVDAMTAYHRALSAGEPFICISALERAGDGVTVRGECTPDAALRLAAPREQAIAAESDGRWQLVLDAPAPLELQAAREDNSSRLAYPPRQWTHAE